MEGNYHPPELAWTYVTWPCSKETSGGLLNLTPFGHPCQVKSNKYPGAVAKAAISTNELSTANANKMGRPGQAGSPRRSHGISAEVVLALWIRSLFCRAGLCSL